MQILPHPVGSVVEFEGIKYIVETINFNWGNPHYALMGHSSLDSRGYGAAWEDHCDVILLHPPSIGSFNMLQQNEEDEE